MRNIMDKFYLGYENRFFDVGKQIKSIAVRQAIFLMISCWIIGLVIMFQDVDLILCGFIIIIVGTICSTLSTIILYGFGELIDKVCEISNNINNFCSCGDVNLKQNHNLKNMINYEVLNDTNDKFDKVLDNNDNPVKNLDEDDLFIKNLFKVLLILIAIIFFLWLINM